MPTYKLQRHTASSFSNLQRDTNSEMNEEPPTRDISVYEFNEGDPKPSGKSASLFKLVFGHGQTQYGQQGKRGKSLGANSKKRKLTAKKLPKKNFRRSKTAAEASSNRSSSASDLIEADDSDSESYQDRRILEKRFGGAPGVSCFNPCSNEDVAAGHSRGVVMHGEELIFLKQRFISPAFSFTADGIVLNLGNSCIVKWALQELESFGSYFNEETGLACIELNLTEQGVRTFLQALGQPLSCEKYRSCHTLSSSLSSDYFSWEESVKQINSLSDGYKMKWRPLKEDMCKPFREPVESSTWEREDLENEHLLADCIACHRCTSDDWFDLIFPTKEDHDAVTVTHYDFLLLNPDQFLSDTIIDFYIKYQQSLLSEEQNRRFYFYNSFFFRKLTEVDKNLQHGFEKRKSSFERVKRWTAKINIFEKDYLFIPIMQSAHWSLVIICHPGSLSAGCQGGSDYKVPMILHFDSLEGCHTFMEEPIRNYLIEAWNEKNGTNDDPQSFSTLKFVAVKAPQQTNYSDCGLFLLHYVELFIKKVLNKDSIDFAFDDWFNPEEASSKRGEIQSLIEHLKAKESAEKPENSCFRTSSNATGPSDEAWSGSGLVGEECLEATNLLTGNMLHQDCSMLVSYPQQYQNNQVCVHTKFGHSHLELGLDREQFLVTRELPQCFGHVQNQAPTSMHCLFQQGAVIHAQDMAMHNCTQEEKECIVHDYDRMRLQESLEDTACHENMEDFYALDRDVGINLADEPGEGPENDTSQIAMAEENCILIKSDSIENNSADAWVLFESSLHNDGNRVSDMPTSTVQKVSLEESPCADAVQKGNESPKDGKYYINDDSLAEQVEKSNKSDPNEGFLESSEPKGWLLDSTGYGDDDLEGKLSNSAANKGVEDGLMQSEVEAYDGVTTPRESLTKRTNPPKAGVVTPSESLKEQTNPSEVGLVTPRELLIKRTDSLEVFDISSPLVEERFGLDRPLSLSSDEGPTPKAAEASKETKRGRRRHTSNLHPATRRVTRSATKRVIDLS